jgi:hypothetical protein
LLGRERTADRNMDLLYRNLASYGLRKSFPGMRRCPGSEASPPAHG